MSASIETTPEQLTDTWSVQSALAELPPDVREINRIYLREMTARSLKTSVEAVDWKGQPVAVFLRHDRVQVFALLKDETIAMANFVSLDHVEFHVDPIGRQQSNEERGPLPNHRTVHAWLTGRLTRISAHGEAPDEQLWQPVRYHPLHDSAFVTVEEQLAVWRVPAVELVPGQSKVWCPRSLVHDDVALPQKSAAEYSQTPAEVRR